MMKRIFCLLAVCTVLIFALSACGYEYCDIELVSEYSRDLAGTELNVYNWGEYISDGSEGSLDVNKEFERITGIHVNYTTFESNETMYSQLLSAGVSYDLIIPSDYMIERMRNENMLKKIDLEKVPNFKFIADEYKGLFFDPDNEYSVVYNVGMVGLIYNTELVSEPPDSWSALWDENYKDNVLMFNNPRDAFAISQFLLGQSINSTDPEEWKAAAEKLKEQKHVLQSYAMDEVYGKMETGEAAMAPYYAGDYLTMFDVNDSLGFVYPKEGTNIFVDSVCIPSCCRNYEAAMMYINFLLEPEIALANAEYIGYASPNTEVINNPDYCYYGEEILYPAEEDKPYTEYFHDIDESIRSLYENLWIDIKLY